MFQSIGFISKFHFGVQCFLVAVNIESYLPLIKILIALSIYECFIKGLVGCINTIQSKYSFSAKCIKAGSFNILSVDNSKGLSITLAP